ncbi:hypothetical protein [Erythrobacter colymbi]|uniref:hypothetical protein n=1 Tax=Erythrobacter colymbi TaxID=1161202 RepID=UPI0012DC266C|nr:hypothetical protein [Erythrobacter colymbi]
MRHGIDLKTHSQCQRSATLTNQHDRLTCRSRIWFRFNNRKFVMCLVEPIGIEPMT